MTDLEQQLTAALRDLRTLTAAVMDVLALGGGDIIIEASTKGDDGSDHVLSRLESAEVLARADGLLNRVR